MSSPAELHMLYRIGNAPIHPFPYPHIYVPDVFPADFYAELLRQLPPADAFSPLSDAHDKMRAALILGPAAAARLPEPARAFWESMARMMLSGELANLVFTKFGQYVQNRFQGQTGVEFSDEAMLVQDSQHYALGPNTDSPLKVLSLLFYLPADGSQSHLGTSIYVPKERSFTCPGGPHYGFERFERMLTMPYLPNSLFGFLKTPNSFHGVEPVNDAGARRNLLLYDVRIRPQAPARAPTTSTGPAIPGTGPQFKF